MMTPSPAVAPSNLFKPAIATPDAAVRQRITRASQDFEASYLSIMLGQMFQGVGDSEFSGGQGEAMFKSFLTEAFSKEIVRAGGVGLAAPVQREMLKLQGLE